MSAAAVHPGQLPTQRARTDVGAVRLDVPGWPAGLGPRTLRGAIEAQAVHLPGGEHSDWTGRDELGVGLHRPPPICYRVHEGRPSLYLAGPRARDHAAVLLYHLRSLRLPSGEVVTVEGVTPEIREVEVGITPDRWRIYRLRSPLWPGDGPWRERPREAPPLDWPRERTGDEGARRLGWAAATLRWAVVTWLRGYGVEETRTRPVEIQVVEIRERPGMEWGRPSRGISDVRTGFAAAFASNAVLPPGVGLGAHAAEGYGECWPA